MKLYTVLDFETTGLNNPAGTDQITQVAAIKYNESEQEVARFSTYVSLNQGKEPSKYSPHVTKTLCETGMTPGQVKDTLFDFIGDTTLVCQSAPFDMSFLDWHPHNFICTRALTWLVEPKENPSLGPTCERHGITLNDHHNAIADVKATKDVLFLMMKKAKEKGIPVSNYHNSVVDFKKRPLTFIPDHAIIIVEE